MQKLQEATWWDEWLAANRATHSDYSDRLISKVIDTIQELKLSNIDLLEIGCGTGLFADRIQNRCSRYLGLDISPAAIALARDRVAPLNFEVADFVTYDVEDHTFDLVVVIDTMAYITDQPAAARKIFRALRPGGVAVLTTVNPFVFRRTSWVAPKGSGQHRRWLSLREFCDLLRHAGLQVRFSATFFPLGDRGILRWTNSRMLNAAADRVLGRSLVCRLKERAGLGGHLLIVAAKPKEFKSL